MSAPISPVELTRDAEVVLLPLPDTRPRILLEAASAGAAQYRRRKDLRRMLRRAIPPTPEAAVAILRPIEEALERRRRARSTNYCLARHVDVLIALVAEMRAARG